ncbi:MAG: hypothetical protein ABDI07_09475, partial [Candidatus Kryptonium sp.]
MDLIYQVGRFDVAFEKSLTFALGPDESPREYQAPLSSIALREYLITDQETKAKVILIYPISLFLNKRVVESLSDVNLKSKLTSLLNRNSVEHSAFFNDPHSLFTEHPHSKIADDFVVISSVGTYEGVVFQSSLNILILQIFTDLV